MHEATNSSLKVIKKQTYNQAINKQINKHSAKQKPLHPISPFGDLTEFLTRKSVETVRQQKP